MMEEKNDIKAVDRTVDETEALLRAVMPTEPIPIAVSSRRLLNQKFVDNKPPGMASSITLISIINSATFPFDKSKISSR